MKRVAISLVICIAVSLLLFSQITNASNKADTENLAKDVIAIEKAALKRWNNGDPSGYLDIYADEITYFDESSKVRLDGIDALRKLYAPLKGKIYNDRFELLNPKVQIHGGLGVLTYNLITYSKGEVTSRWNSTAVYYKINGKWKVIHSHWSHTKHK